MVFGETPAQLRGVGRLRRKIKKNFLSLFETENAAEEVESRNGIGGTWVRVMGLGTPNHPHSISSPVVKASRAVLWALVG